ncbi:MFS transporter [Coraliomargarita sp. W4R53]
MPSKYDFLKLSELGTYRRGTYFGFTNAFVWMIALGTPMVLLSEKLGASPSQLGMMYAAVFLLLPVQLASTALLPILGFRRQILWAWGIRALCLIVPVGIVFWAPEQPDGWVLALFMSSIFGFCFFRAIGATAMLPWMFDILPERIRGRYFATDSLVVGLAGVLTLLLSSLLFYLLSPYNAFRVLFSLTLVAAVVSLSFLRKLPDGRRPVVIPLSRFFRRAPELCFRPSHYRRFLRLQVIYGIAGYAFAPFSIYYLKTTLDYSQSYILALMALQFMGMFGAGMIIKEWIDRIGPKPFFVLSNLATISFQIYWLLMILFPGALEMLLPLVYLLVGLALSSYQTSTNKYLSQVCRPSERTISVTLFSAVVGFIGGLTSTGWGFVLKDSESGRIDTHMFLIYFGSAIVLQIILLKGYMKIKDTVSPEEALPARGMLVKPFRYLVTFINMVEPPVARRAEKEPKR